VVVVQRDQGRVTGETLADVGNGGVSGSQRAARSAYAVASLLLSATSDLPVGPGSR